MHGIGDEPSPLRCSSFALLTSYLSPQHSQHLFRVGLGLDLGPDFSDATVGTNQECHPKHAHVFFSKKALLAPGAVGLRNLPLFINQQSKGKPVFFDELVM